MEEGGHLNTRAKKILRNINYTVSANFFVMGISILLNLFVPKFIGVKEYSYWQLYVFYSSYVGFFHFGWLDGIYLKIGGKDYAELDHAELGSQFWYLFIFENILSIIIIFLVLFFSNSPGKTIILVLTAFVSVIRNCNTFIIYIFQSTNRIKEYAQISRNDRYFYVFFLCIYILADGDNYIVMILLDIISRMIVTVWGFIKLKDIMFNKPLNISVIKNEIFDNIKIGSNLMISNIAGMLIIGISRLLVEFKWDVETFGKLSLTLSISNMFMTFINAVGVVVFPLLRRTNPNKLIELYKYLRNIFVPFSYSLLIFFLPVKKILEIWLPSYKESLIFMGILFPMIIYEGRMSLLITTYLKTIRKEKLIFYANILSLVFSVILSFISAILFNNLLMSVGSILLALALRCIIGELLLVKTLDISIKKKILLESIITIIFVLSNVLINDISAFVIYSISFAIYLILSAEDFFYSLKKIKKMFQS